MTCMADVLGRLKGVRPCGDGRLALCPAHEDRVPSLSITEVADGRVLLHCHAGCSLDAILGALGLRKSELFPDRGRRTLASNPRTGRQEAAATFTPSDAQRVWQLAFQRACDDEGVDRDRAVYAYLDGRGIGESWELRCFGILAEGMALPVAVAHWPTSGHQLVGALYDYGGEVAGVQARTVLRREPKTLFPKGGKVKGLAFADRRGLDVLRGARADAVGVVLGEGFTDYLGLSVASPLPVLAAPGTTFAADAVGPWVRGRILYLALDNDDAGEKAVGQVAAQAYAQGCARVQRIRWPEQCKDACEVVALRGIQGLEEFLVANTTGVRS
jgi:hypothetical protein